MAFINGPNFQQSINHIDKDYKRRTRSQKLPNSNENIYQHKYRQIDQIPEFYRRESEPCEGSDMETKGVA